MDCQVVSSPVSDEVRRSLRAGDKVLLSGVFYTARDAAHYRICQALEKDEHLPVELAGQTIYYCGPSPTPPGKAIGSAGPTTSSRLDKYTPCLLKAGVRALIGKGQRSSETLQVMRSYGAVYLITLGGCGAYLSKKVTKAEVVAYNDLGPEAVLRLEVVDFPALVASDTIGGNIFDGCYELYRR